MSHKVPLCVLIHYALVPAKIREQIHCDELTHSGDAAMILRKLLSLVVWRGMGAGILALLRRAFARAMERREPVVNIDDLSDDRLRDIGLLDGRGPSVRRPERAEAEIRRP
jgi:hypothetical protein